MSWQLKLLVEPEGIKKEFTDSFLLCRKQLLHEKVTKKMKMDIPKPFVPGSVFAELLVVGRYFNVKSFTFTIQK